MAKAKSAIPEGHHTVTPQLAFDDAVKALEWYKRALGAEEMSRHLGPDGKVMHAEIRIGDSRIMLNDAMMGAKGPKALGGSPASLWLYVEDCDSLFKRAIAAGGRSRMAAWARCRTSSGAIDRAPSSIPTATPGPSRRIRKT